MSEIKAALSVKKRDTRFDLAIVGGGMVGASLACALADTGLTIGLFDGVRFSADDIPLNNKELFFDPRVSAISPASKNWLDQLGVWEDIAASRVSPYEEMFVWDGDGTGSVKFSASDINEPQLGFIVENSVILKGVYKKLAQLPQIKILAPAKVESLERVGIDEQQHIAITTEDGDIYQATLLIGADGPNSQVRQLAGFKTREWEYRHQAIVTTVRSELPHQATAWQRFMDSGPLAFLPLIDSAETDTIGSNQHFCSIVWSVVPDRAETLMALDEEEFARLLTEEIEHKLGDIQWVDKRFTFPLRQRHAVDYVQDSIALVGDAAHTIHPLAGQGVNLGFLDAKVLANEISDSLVRQRPLYEPAILRRYQRQRIGHNLGMMWLMEGFKFLFAEQPLPVRWLRNAGMRGVDNTSLVKNRLMRQAMGA